jgi:glycosyltransferase involved in cell wall biosynthesis
VVALEVASLDHYPWELNAESCSFHRHTLFPEATYQHLRPSEISSRVQAALAHHSPDVVALNGWSVPEARAANAWCRRQGVPTVLMSETKADDGPGRRPWWKERIKAHLVRQSQAALVGGRPQLAYLVQLGFPPAHIFLGYDAVDNAYFSAQATHWRSDPARVRAEAGLPDLYFFACTRFLARKNLDGLLRAYAAYRRITLAESSLPPWDLVLAGSGEAEPALRQLQADLDLSGVYWPGFLPYNQLPLHFALASAFVHPAKEEAWGLVVNEAAACGLPLLVGHSVGAAQELVQPGRNGWCFDSHSDAAITEALLAVSRLSDTERLAMGHHSLQIVANWGPDRFAQGMLDAVACAIHKA